MNNREYHRQYRERNREKIRESLRKAAQEKKDHGFCQICAWGVPAVPGSTMCERHLQARRDRRGKHYQKRLDEKLCTSCGRPALPGKKSCEKCLIVGCKGVRRRGDQGKRRIVEYLGGKCQRCGLVTDIMPVYEIHHLTKKNKEFNIKAIRGWSWEAIKRELDKGVQLLCANCHRIIQYSHPENWAVRSL